MENSFKYATLKKLDQKLSPSPKDAFLRALVRVLHEAPCCSALCRAEECSGFVKVLLVYIGLYKRTASVIGPTQTHHYVDGGTTPLPLRSSAQFTRLILVSIVERFKTADHDPQVSKRTQPKSECAVKRAYESTASQPFWRAEPASL